jgi:hypothetical protein
MISFLGTCLLSCSFTMYKKLTPAWWLARDSIEEKRRSRIRPLFLYLKHSGFSRSVRLKSAPYSKHSQSSLLSGRDSRQNDGPRPARSV